MPPFSFTRQGSVCSGKVAIWKPGFDRPCKLLRHPHPALPSRTTFLQRQYRSPEALYFDNRKTPAQTNSAASQRRRSTFSLRNSFAAKAFPRNVSDALAGAASETSTFDSVKSRAKKLNAIDSKPNRNIGLETTARVPPPTPHFARAWAGSPMGRMPPAVSTSPATAVAATVTMVTHV